MSEALDALVVGAGVAGLSCARALQATGMRVLVVDKGRGVGGRCASRRVDGQVVDHGVSFLHGNHESFLSELQMVPATALIGWPGRVKGQGTPCQPEAFRPGTRCMAFAEGVSAFPKELSKGLSLRLETKVLRIEAAAGMSRVYLENGEVLQSRRLILTAPIPQTLALLQDWPRGEGIRALLEMVVPHASLTLLAGYPLDFPEPDFDVYFPDDSRAIQSLIHDSAKRPHPRWRVLVAQARPAWSAAHLEEPDFAAELLLELERLLGPPWGQTAWMQGHRWRFATITRGAALPRPYLQRTEDGTVLAIAGDAFHPAGGVEGAYLSGLTLARLLLQENS